MKRVALAIAALVGFSSVGLCDKEADRQKALQVYKEYYQLTLDATRAKTEVKAALFRDQAAQKHGFKNWKDFSDRMSLVLAKEDWTWVTDEAGKWYKAEQAKPATPPQPPTPAAPPKEAFRGLAMGVFKDYYAKLVDAQRKGVAADFSALMEESAKKAGFAGWNDFVSKMAKALGNEEWKAVNASAQEWYTAEMDKLAAEEAKKAAAAPAGPGPEGFRGRPGLPPAFRPGAKFGWLHDHSLSLEVKELSGEWIRADRRTRSMKLTNPEAVAKGIPPVEEEVEVLTADLWIHVPSQKWAWKLIEAGPADPAAPPERQPRAALPPSIGAGARLEIVDAPDAAAVGTGRFLVKAVWGNWVQAYSVRRRGRTGPEVWLCMTALGPFWKATDDKSPRSREEMQESVSSALMAFYKGNLDAIRRRQAVNLSELQNACAQEEGFQDWTELFRAAKEILGADEVKKLEEAAVKWYEEEMNKGRPPRRDRDR